MGERQVGTARASVYQFPTLLAVVPELLDHWASTLGFGVIGRTTADLTSDGKLTLQLEDCMNWSIQDATESPVKEKAYERLGGVNIIQDVDERFRWLEVRFQPHVIGKEDE